MQRIVLQAPLEESKLSGLKWHAHSLACTSLGRANPIHALDSKCCLGRECLYTIRQFDWNNRSIPTLVTLMCILNVPMYLVCPSPSLCSNRCSLNDKQQHGGYVLQRGVLGQHGRRWYPLPQGNRIHVVSQIVPLIMVRIQHV